LFNMNGGKITRALSRGPSDETWHTIDAGYVDTLTVAHCPEGNPTEGDYLWVDVPKYTIDEAAISVTFLGTKAMADSGELESGLWEVADSVAEFDGDVDQRVDVPVVFFKRQSRGLSERVPREKLPLPDLEGWLEALDALADGPAPADSLKQGKKFLEMLRDDLRATTNQADASFSELFNAKAFPYLCRFQDRGMRNPVMALFQWS